MKKRILAFIVFLTVLCTAFPTFAENTVTGSCGKDLTWIYNYSEKTLTISGRGNMPNYYSNSRAGSLAPWVNSTNIKNDLETVVISEGVTSIGEYAFFECTSLKNIVISGSVKTINIGAFYQCAALPGITIPNSVTSIGDEAFEHCAGLKEITIPGSVKNIGNGAFSSCHISAEESESGIESGLEKVTIQDGVEAIGKFAFDGCRKLKDVTLPDSIKSIGDNAFQQTGLYNDYTTWEELYIGNHLIKVDEWALNQGGTNDYRIDPGTKTIADHAFDGCISLTSITIPDSVVNIGDKAFNGCTGITNMKIPDSVTSIGDEAFYSCSDLTSISVDADNSAYCSENGILYNKSKTEIMRFPSDKTGVSFTIPDGVTKIADGAFEFCRHLTSITIPDGVESIGNNAFSNCYFEEYQNGKIISKIGLEKITIPDSVTSIGNSAFLRCSKLTSIVIPDGVIEISERTFYYCSNLTSITIPNSVRIIGKEAFEGCPRKIKVNYIGSTTDWNEVIGDGKYVLANVGINYISGISTKHSDDGKIVVKLINIDTGKTVIMALYDGDKLAEMQLSSEYSETNREITFTPTKDYTRAKVMVWESLASMSSVCESKIVK